MADPAPTVPTKSYAYGFDGEAFGGHFTSRAEALAAARQAAALLPEPPEGVFTARRRPVDLHAAALSGVVTDSLRHAFEAEGVTMRRPTADEVAALNADLQSIVTAWLHRHKLVDIAEEFEAVSEEPIPLIEHVRQPPTDEVGPLGET
jgi:hypothetical protein